MLTRMKVLNFKLFDEVEIDLGRSVVFIGPNNSGKSTALQALVLWNVGLKRWNEKRKDAPELGKGKRKGVTVNRKDLFSIPAPSAALLWRDLHVRDLTRQEGALSTANVRIEIVVEGVSAGSSWSCGLEFDYANAESFYCRPLRLSESKTSDRMRVPDGAKTVKVAFLPPMSGLTDTEYEKQRGEIEVLIGQGRTAEVLRNLCYRISRQPDDTSWGELNEHMGRLFGVEFPSPEMISERSEIALSYQHKGGPKLDISCAGRGLQQTLLLLAHIYGNPGTVLLIDEPDAHLEILRQRQTYQLLTEVAERRDSQIVCASHSEVVLNEAAGRDVVVAFVGKPHRIDDRPSQVLKSLREIGFDHYYQAQQVGWVLYLEGSTDLAILRKFAQILDHPAAAYLERPFVEYVGNEPRRARDHFYGLREACARLAGIAIFDRLEKPIEEDRPLIEMTWTRCEIENYLCMHEVLLAYARGEHADDLFGHAEAEHRVAVMQESIAKLSTALDDLGKPGPWSPDIKATDEFLDPLFLRYFKELNLPHLLSKGKYHELASLVPKEKLDAEIAEKLDAIVAVAERARKECE